MRARATHPTDIITKVNVTPIIDVALVLVIILLVTAPLLSVADLPVNLPQARTRDSEDERNISVTCTTVGELAVDETRVPAGGLTAALRERLARPGERDVLVVLRADETLPYEQVRTMLDDARAAGARRIAVATRQRTGARP
jgi:biopolymer transport protein TolR